MEIEEGLGREWRMGARDGGVKKGKDWEGSGECEQGTGE